MSLAIDQDQRDRALDVTGSFIVQAPAGSGKTELLTQRYLSLLAVVGKPEEIIAITFTRKAASEMRRRITDALRRSADDTEPGEPHEHKTWLLGRAALEQDRQQQWQLLDQPSRLRVLTFDALCASLARQMPILSRFGASPGMAADPQSLYVQAARRTTLLALDSDDSWSPSVERLLLHLDNNFNRVEVLLSTMLARRDQWLRHLGAGQNAEIERETLEAVLAQLVGSELQHLVECIAGRLENLPAIARRAAALWPEGKQAPDRLGDLQQLPGAGPDDLDTWKQLANLLLTNSDGWRSRLDKNCGFPTASKEPEKSELAQHKAAMMAIIDSVCDDDALLEVLALVRKLPTARYTDEQWAVFEALTEVLPVAAAQLKLVFAETGEVDFVEVAQAANRALGDADNPTDLALSLDYRISHLLVDEFQDTSVSQYQLLNQLTAGWQAGDGRTLFVVGDPMQSIYRFREAQVGLYLRARREGVGEVLLENVQLTQNFRSCIPVIEWVNSSFARIFPQQEDQAVGAVTYAPSQSRKANDDSSVTVHPFVDMDRKAEAQRVLDVIRQTRQANADASIAILVRSRSHLVDIVAALRHAGLGYRAVDIDSLAERQVIQDVVALARALMHRGDRLAWLSVLRAPWCGLEHADLLRLADDRHALIYSRLHDEQAIASLGEDGRQRVLRVLPILDAALADVGRRSWRRLIEGTWLALAGPACVYVQSDLHDVSVLLDRIEHLEQAGELHDPLRLEALIQDLYAAPDSDGDARLQLMTIHKSKGLQFDTVIIPGLGRTSRADDKALLLWSEIPVTHNRNALLLAPVHGTGENEDAIYQYLKQLEARRNINEATRLLYVAVTRAKSHVHLLGHVKPKSDGNGDLEPGTPPSTSLLAILWPVVQDIYDDAFGDYVQPEQQDDAGYRSAQGVDRLPLSWSAPGAPASMLWQGIDDIARDEQAVEYEWAGQAARYVGTVVHRVLQHMAEEGAEGWSEQRIRQAQGRYRCLLERLGLGAGDLDRAVERVIDALVKTLRDSKGRWLLQAHEQAQCEYRLTTIQQGRISNRIIDRTFIDEDGVRWIIDYKASSHSGGGLDEFLDREVDRYREQLDDYARIMKQLEDRPVKLALYFPLLQAWREWQ
ncbi:MAG: UvrD-helicase domain-containing protein [Gammaproteobacteria bacterium]|nr:UvrD-helicase domain-containing protein [Gammaproteobacteria bacterium]